MTTKPNGLTEQITDMAFAAAEPHITRLGMTPDQAADYVTEIVVRSIARAAAADPAAGERILAAVAADVASRKTCAEDFAGRPCGKPVTDTVEWDMHPDGRRRPESPVTHYVCGGCADDLVSWRASHLSPRRTPIA